MEAKVSDPEASPRDWQPNWSLIHVPDLDRENNDAKAEIKVYTCSILQGERLIGVLPRAKPEQCSTAATVWNFISFYFYRRIELLSLQIIIIIIALAAMVDRCSKVCLVNKFKLTNLTYV